MRVRAAILMMIACSGCLCLSCRRATAPGDAAVPDSTFDPSLVRGDRALEEVRRFVEIAPRDSGTAGAARAAAYIAARLEAAGLTVEIDEFEEYTPSGKKTFRNVTGVLRGSGEKVIILGSHYDTKAGIGVGFQGANDSGSSTGLLLELASVVTNGPVPGASIAFTFFDGEECMASYGPNDGLHGSRRMARKLADDGEAARVIAVVVLDMIGDRDLAIGIPRNSSPVLSAAAFEAGRAAGFRSKLSLVGEILDDHVPFLAVGIDAIDLIDFRFGSEPGSNDYWHTPEDTMDKLSAESLEITGRITIHMLNILLRRDAG